METTNNRNWSFLSNVYDTCQADIIKSLLEDEDIPVLEKHQGSGAYVEIITGISSTGIDLYVPDFRLLEAQEIINAIPDSDLSFIPEPEIQDEVTNLAHGKSIGLGLIMFFVISALAAFVYYIFTTWKDLIYSLFH